MTLSEAQLNRFVDQRYIDRGREYFERGQVVLETVTDRKVQASCVGGRVYKVSLARAGSKLNGTCTCPAFEDFGPCKHIAAVALAVMAAQKSEYTPSRGAVGQVEESRALRERLLALEKPDLVDLVLSLTSEEDLLWLLDDDR